MLIFLIEDDHLKAAQIQAYISETWESLDVQHFRSYQSGLKAIEKTAPNLIGLDMTLPTFDISGSSRHGRPRALGGFDLMRKLKRKGIYVPTFVITQLETFGEGVDQVSFEEITSRCAAEFSEFFMGSVFYSQTSDVWKTALKEVIDELVRR